MLSVKNHLGSPYPAHIFITSSKTQPVIFIKSYLSLQSYGKEVEGLILPSKMYSVSTKMISSCLLFLPRPHNLTCTNLAICYGKCVIFCLCLCCLSLWSTLAVFSPVFTIVCRYPSQMSFSSASFSTTKA